MADYTGRAQRNLGWR